MGIFDLMQKYTLSSQGKARLIFTLVLTFIIAYWFFAFDGFDFYDDYAYSYFANEMAEGRFHPGESHFSHRIGMFAPLAVLYYFFGLNDHLTILWPLLCHLSGVFLVFFVFDKKDKGAAVAGALMAGLSFYPLFFCKELYPDTVVSCFGMASAFLLFKVRDRKEGYVWFFPLLFVCFVFEAFLAKETSLYFFPFYILLFIHDLLRKINLKFWMLTILFSLAFAFIYLAWYKINTGSFFYRFQAIQEGHYEFPGSYYQRSLTEYLPRLTYEPFLLLLHTEMIIPVLMAIPAIGLLKLKEMSDLRKTESFWICLAVLILMMFWFSSTSLKFYNPIFLQGRMILMLVPPLGVLAGLGWKKINESTFWNAMVAALFFVLAVCYYFFFSPQTALIYFLLALLLGSVYLFRKQQFKNFALFMLLLVLSVHPLYSMMKPTDTGYKSEKEAINRFLKRGEGKNMVIVDPQLYSGHLYYYGFHVNPHYEFVKYNTIRKDQPLKADNYYVLINQHTWDLFHQLEVPYPVWVLHPPEEWKLLFEKDRVRLYQIDAGSIIKYF
jgi:hypothetical protein